MPEVLERMVNQERKEGTKKGPELVAITRYNDKPIADLIRRAATMEGVSVSTFQRKSVIEQLKIMFGEEWVDSIVQAAEETQVRLRKRPRKRGVLAQIRAMRG
ncbi:MAG: hypothetical protein V1495_04990 [Pseudomonadota bacterium]